jgi:hypothetical protein
MGILSDKLPSKEVDEFMLNRLLRSFEDEDVDGLDDVISSFRKTCASGVYDELKTAFDSRFQFYQFDKMMDYEVMPQNSVYSLAYENLDHTMPKLGYIIRFQFFKSMYKLIEYRYCMTKKELYENDMRNVYLSGLDERLLFSLNNFNETSNLPQLSSEFFQKLKVVNWENKTSKKFAKKLKHLKIRFAYTRTALVKYQQLHLIEEAFIELIAGCSAVNDDRDYITKEDIITSYKTYLKLLNTDVTKYKARNALNDKEHVGGGYLVCDQCNEYYKLQPGESQDDFDGECECGGKLQYYADIDWLLNNGKD